jgi:CCAAT-binding transcription factor (CBF-B/NF-YA) subunit B
MLASFFQQQPHPLPTGSTLQMIPTAAASPIHLMNPQQQQQLNAEAMANAAVSASFLAFLQQSGCPPPVAQPQPQQAPTYVNAKQYIRILKRRQTRSILDDYYQRQIQQRRKRKQEQSFKYESRHNHAMKRPRDAHGRFLNGQALEDYYEQHPEEAAQRREFLEAKRTKTFDEKQGLPDPLTKKIKTEKPQNTPDLFADAKPEAKNGTVQHLPAPEVLCLVKTE